MEWLRRRAEDVAAAMLVPGNATPVPNYPGVTSVGFALFGINGPDTPLGDARQITQNKLYSNTIGFEVELDRDGFLDGWNIDAYYQYGKNHQYFDTDNGIRVDRIPLALDAVRHPTTNEIVCHAAIVNPAFADCVPMNIFGGVQNISEEAAAYVVDDVKHNLSTVEQTFVEVVLDGELFEGFGAGPVSMAVGASYREDTFSQGVLDPTDEFVFLGGQNTGSRGLIPELPGTPSPSCVTYNPLAGMCGVRAGSVPSEFP